MAEQGVDGLIATLDDYLVKKAPFAIPEGGKEFLVRFGPWISVLFLILLLPILLLALGIGTILVPFAGLGYARSFGLGATIALVQMVLLILALPGLFKRQAAGWRMLFYEQLVGLVGGILSGAIVGPLLGALIGLYVLFQIRSKYVN